MATVIGNPARYATDRSVRAFQRMLLTTMIVLFVIGAMEGFIFATLFSMHLSSLVVLATEIAGGAIVLRLCAAQSQRVDRYERERMNWKSGAEGECVVASALDRLPNAYVVFHDFNTARGNFDHLVVGPTGIFAIETKNWRGTISANASGELLQDGAPASQPHVKQLLCRIMAVKDKVVALAGPEVFIQGVMVFPKARVQAKYGTTRNVHCLREGRLCQYIEDEKFRRKLTTEQIDLFTRAFRGIAGMDSGFGKVLPLAGTNRKRESDSLTSPSYSSAS